MNLPQQNDNQIISAAPALPETVIWEKRIRRDDIEKYWMDSIGKKELGPEDTARLTASIPYMDKRGVYDNTQKTLSEQVRNVEELITLMGTKYNSVRENEWKYDVGFSMSSGVFHYRAPEIDETGKQTTYHPEGEQLLTIQNMVIDLDAHTESNPDNKTRFNFNGYCDVSRRLIAMQTLNRLNKILVDSKSDISLQVKNVYCTGGGLQFIISFDKELIRSEAIRLFGYIKKHLTKGQIREKIQGFDSLGNLVSCYLDVDPTSGDITHTQRIGGTLNPKKAYFGAFAEELLDFYDSDKMDDAQIQFKTLLKNSDCTGAKQSELTSEITDAKIEFKKYYDLSKEKINSQKLLSLEVMMRKSYDVYREADSELYKTSSLADLELIRQIPVEKQVAYMEQGLTRTETATGYNKYLCPFHKEDNGSFSIYKNTDKIAAVAKDFHEGGTSYNIVSYTMAKKEVLGIDAITRNEAIQRLVIHFELKLTKTDIKQFNSDVVSTAVADYIARIDVENFCYYRLANKNRNCVIREFENGEAFVFDGTHMMSDHILMNQLGIHRADNELRMAFHDQFVEKILENAFEEFSPGKPYTYERKFIKYINLWIPGKAYKKVHELAESLLDMDIVSALSHIKERLPAMWHYLNQITQKGNIEYFTNWLAAIAKFEVMSSIPVVTSVQGTGKNLFIDEVFSFYLNREYVNVVNGDKIANNFNSFLGTSSLVVLDEGDFSNTKELNNLKLLSGNKYIQVEKKGVDSSQVERHFNMIMFTNGETPLHHPSNDRRVSYFRLDVTLEDSVKYAGYEYIDDFIEVLKEEVTEFWAVMVKTKTRKEWVNMNIKDNQFNKQILLMHPFGKLVIKLVEDDWEYIRLQMNENVQDPMVITSNLEMLATIKSTFDQYGTIDLTLVNKYIYSLNFKSYVGVQQFIDNNALHRSGITKITTPTSVKIIIDKKKVQQLIHMNNNLGNLYPAYNHENINTTLQKELITIEDVLNERAVNEQIDMAEMALVMNPNSDPLGIAKPVDPRNIVQ